MSINIESNSNKTEIKSDVVVKEKTKNKTKTSRLSTRIPQNNQSNQSGSKLEKSRIGQSISPQVFEKKKKDSQKNQDENRTLDKIQPPLQKDLDKICLAESTFSIVHERFIELAIKLPQELQQKNEKEKKVSPNDRLKVEHEIKKQQHRFLVKFSDKDRLRKIAVIFDDFRTIELGQRIKLGLSTEAPPKPIGTPLKSNPIITQAIVAVLDDTKIQVRLPNASDYNIPPKHYLSIAGRVEIEELNVKLPFRVNYVKAIKEHTSSSTDIEIMQNEKSTQDTKPIDPKLKQDTLSTLKATTESGTIALRFLANGFRMISLFMLHFKVDASEAGEDLVAMFSVRGARELANSTEQNQSGVTVSVVSVLINAALVLKERAKMYIKEGETPVEFDRKLVAFSRDCVRQCFKNYSSEDKAELMKLSKRIDVVIKRATSGENKTTTVTNTNEKEMFVTDLFKEYKDKERVSGEGKTTTDVKDTNEKLTNTTTVTNSSVSGEREITTTVTTETQSNLTTETNGSQQDTSLMPVREVPRERPPQQRRGIVPRHLRVRPFTMARRLRDMR